MRKTLALFISVLMLVSCFSVLASAATATPTITDGTANATGTVIRPLSSGLHVVPAIGISDGTEWNSRYPEGIWTYEENIAEQLQSTDISNGYYPTIKVNQAEGDPVEVQVNKFLRAVYERVRHRCYGSLAAYGVEVFPIYELNLRLFDFVVSAFKAFFFLVVLGLAYFFVCVPIFAAVNCLCKKLGAFKKLCIQRIGE